MHMNLELFIIKISDKNTTQLLLCNGFDRVIKKINDYTWENFREYIDWDEESFDNHTCGTIASHFKTKLYFTFQTSTFTIVDSEILS